MMMIMMMMIVQFFVHTYIQMLTSPLGNKKEILPLKDIDAAPQKTILLLFLLRHYNQTGIHIILTSPQ